MKEETLCVYPPTVEQELEACRVFAESYDESFARGIMTDDQMLEWMMEHEVWSHEDDKVMEGLKKDLNRLRMEIFSARNNEVLRERIRLYIRAGEKQTRDLLKKRYEYYDKTCEGVASSSKELCIIKACTFTMEDALYDWGSCSPQAVLQAHKGCMLEEGQIRDLARNDPWKSLWSIREKANITLFNNEDRELNLNQKNLIIWSSVYDSIQESIDCPADDVIEDDDMLDGWFVAQGEKRKREKAEMEFENSTSDAIKNADEVFIVANTERDRDRIEGLNHVHGRMVKKEREALLMHKHKNADGSTGQGEFRDEQLKMTTAHNQMYKGKFGG
jgi:hypothetical protein